MAVIYKGDSRSGGEVRCRCPLPYLYSTSFSTFFSRPTPIGGREIHIGWIREEEGWGPLASSPGQGLASYTKLVWLRPDPVTGPWVYAWIAYLFKALSCFFLNFLSFYILHIHYKTTILKKWAIFDYPLSYNICSSPTQSASRAPPVETVPATLPRSAALRGR